MYHIQDKQRKILKILLWALGSVVALILLVLTVLQVYVNTHKASFVKLVNEKLNDAVAGTAAIGDVDINVWRHFPNVDIRLHDVSLKDSLYNKPLLQMKYISTRLNVLRLISNEVDIHNLYLEDGIIHLFTDKNGYSNNYLFNKNKEKKPGAHPATIDEIELKNIDFLVEQMGKDKWIGVQFNSLHANLEYADSITSISMSEDALIKGLGFNLDNGYFLKDKTLTADWKLTFNNQSKELAFPETAVKIGPTDFLIQGAFYLLNQQDSHFKLLVKSSSIGYKEAASLVSQNITKKINLVELTKPLSLTANIEGPMAPLTIPIVNVQWVVAHNQLVTPALTLDDCSFTGSFTNERNKAYPRTDDNSEVMLAKLSASWGGISLIANTNTIVTNLVHPVLQFDFTSATTLAALDDKLGLSTIHFLKGGALLNLQYNGPLGASPAMMQYLSGNLVINKAEVNYAPRNLTFSNCNGEIIFSQSALLVRNLQCDLNTNHFKVEVAGQNLNVLAAGNQTGPQATVLCTVFTPDLNLNDFRTLFAARQTTVKKNSSGGAAKPAVQLDNALENGTLDMTLQADAVHMNRFTARNVQGRIAFTNNDMDVQKVSLQHADGKLTMSAKVHQVNDNYHEASTSVNLENINVQKLFYAFSNFGMKGLTSDNLRGTLNTNTHIKVGINSKGDVVKNSMEGNLQFSLKNGALKDFEALKSIQKVAFKNRDFSNIEFAELKDSLELHKDQIYIHRMEIESSALTLFVEGIYSFGNNTNISIQVPLSNLKKRDDDYVVENKGANRKAGASLYLRAKSADDGSVKIGLDLFKKVRGDDFVKDFKGSDSLKTKN